MGVRAHEISFDISFGILRDFVRYRLGFCEISYEISFGILRDFVRDIVWDFARSRTKYNERGFVTDVSNTEGKRALITRAWS